MSSSMPKELAISTASSGGARSAGGGVSDPAWTLMASISFSNPPGAKS
jgi:hypothetical protein